MFLQALKSGLISNPDLIEQIRLSKQRSTAQEIQRFHLEISDLWCPSCAELIQLVLVQERGIEKCIVDYATDLALIEFNPRILSKEQICRKIEILGYTTSSLISPEQRPVSRDLYARFGIAAFCALNIMMFSYPLYATYFHYDDQSAGPLFAWLSFFTSLPVVFYSGWPIFRRFFASLPLGILGMETLVVIGITCSFGLSTFDLIQGGTKVYFDSMTVIIALVLLGKIVETKAKFTAKDALLRLARAMPRRGRKKLADGSTSFVPIKDFIPGDFVLVFTGEKIVLDGLILEGEGSCDESLITGEAIPVKKSPGDTVIGGTILQNGTLTIEVTRTLDESSLQKIIEMVEKDIGRKTIFVRRADEIVRWFVPFVLLIAFSSGLFVLFTGMSTDGTLPYEEAIVRAISVLLISCPCAIGIAVPLAEAHLLNAAAHMGAIIRNRSCLQWLGQISVFVFDKTGTITKGKYKLLRGQSELTIFQKQIVKGMAARSTHPAALALATGLETEGFNFDNVDEIAGKGLRAQWEGIVYYLGSQELLRLHSIDDIILSRNAEPITPVYFGSTTGFITTFELGDEIKEEALSLLRSLHSDNTWLVSGDEKKPVEMTARACGFSAFRWGHTPLEKRDLIETLREQGETVAMVGDGINDAPALAAAHVGISVLSATEISIQVSDILLTTDSLALIPQLQALASKGHKIASQNIFWAFFYNVIGIGIAAAGFLSPVFSAFAMVASSLMIIINTQRLRHTKQKKPIESDPLLQL